ncbi:MAG TPA: SPFH domain-containing protein [Chloroflexota bacterium]|nr:SPFH domain-containing protein [Chloroflexota bacterium]
MEDETLMSTATPSYTQLTQERVPLEDAAVAFTQRDASGRIPIIIIPTRPFRIRNDVIILAVLMFGAAILFGFFLSQVAMASLTAVLGVLLLVLGIYRSFIVRIPEGSTAILTRGGRYLRTIGPGMTLLPPWILVAYLITNREIPFDVPLVELPTQDNVRANVDMLITFRITDAYKFVYNISAADFDQVFQAVCQDGLRSMMRHITLEQVVDLKKQDLTYMLEELSTAVAAYGATVTNLSVTYAQPPAEFMQSLEARQLAMLQQEEQKQRQALAKRRQTDVEELARQEVVAEVERDKESIEVQIQRAEARRRLVELEAEAEDLRLQKLQERLQKYPEAAQYDVGLIKLEVARSLAGNTRAMLQMGSADDIVKAFVMRDVLQDLPFPGDDDGREAPPEPSPAKRSAKPR